MRKSKLQGKSSDASRGQPSFHASCFRTGLFDIFFSPSKTNSAVTSTPLDSPELEVKRLTQIHVLRRCNMCIVCLPNRYSIDRNTDEKRQFSVDPNGLVTVTGKLDRETMAVHRVHILAIDKGIHPSIQREFGSDCMWEPFSSEQKNIISERIPVFSTQFIRQPIRYEVFVPPFIV